MTTRYERPEVLATYSADELVTEAAVCFDGYGPTPTTTTVTTSSR